MLVRKPFIDAFTNFQGKQVYAQKRIARAKAAEAKAAKSARESLIRNGDAINNHSNGYANGVSKKIQ